jgi:hypothetical protein
MRAALVLAAALLTCLPVSAADKGRGGGDEIRNYLRRCPDWETVDSDEADMRQAITTIYLKMAHYPTADVHAGLILYLQESAGSWRGEYEAWSKVYAFYRVFFKVGDGFYPLDSGDKVKPHDFQGIEGRPLNDPGQANLLWPYSTNKSGQLELQYVEFVGERTRGGYLPLRDFNDLMRRFGRRFDEPSTDAPSP